MGIFSRNSTSPTNTAPAPPPKTNSTSPSSHNHLFSNRRSSSPTRTSVVPGHRRSGEDPSITSARERVLRAEAAERDADRALVQARAAVRDARLQVQRLEKEAAEEARLAKIKQHQAKDISKRARPLGRHEHV